MKIWIKSLICLISFLICFFGEIVINFACGPEADPYDYYASFFHNNLLKTNEYEAFNFTSYQFLYNETEPVSEAEVNSKEWADYLGGNVKPADVKHAMYELDGRTDTLINIGYLVNKGAVPDSLQTNTFFKGLAKNKSALQYYRFSKEVEPFACTDGNYWDPKPRDTISQQRYSEKALKLASAEKDKFLKLRYYYQAQRLLHYHGDNVGASAVYDKHIANHKSNTRVKGWALALKAGEERWLGDTIEAAYHFSKVFAQNPERRVMAYRNYRYISAKQPAVLALAKNDEEKANLYAIEAFGNPGLDIEPLKRVYDCQPRSPLVGALLTREVNKLEAVYLTPALTDPKTPIKSSFWGTYVDEDKNALPHIKKLNALCERIAADRKYDDYALGYLASAYLSWMKKDTKTGLIYLFKLKNARVSDKLNDQKQIINLLLMAQGMQKNNSLQEAELLSSLKWVDKKVVVETKGSEKLSGWEFYGDHPFTTTARNFYRSVLVPQYLKQGDTAKAAIAMLASDVTLDEKASSYQTDDFWQNFLGSKVIKQLISWKQTPPLDPYLHFLSKRLKQYHTSVLYELLGTAYLREHKYANAITAFKRVPNTQLTNQIRNYFDNEADGTDPFISRLADYPKVYLTGNSKEYNKLDFAKAMAALQKQINGSSKNPDVYYKYATALYNTATHGNAWSMISYQWSSYDYGRKSQYYYDADYIKSANAEKYYLKARQLSKNAEFKAKCTFMAAKCQQKQIPFDEADSNYDMLVRQNPYFRELRDGYKKTAFFKRAVNECSYLQDFLNGKTKGADN
jgi:tetratricopeptide (TPR) repeat protein